MNNDSRFCVSLDNDGNTPGEPFDVFPGRPCPYKKLININIRNIRDMEDQDGGLIEVLFGNVSDFDSDLCDCGHAGLRIVHLYPIVQKIDVYMDGKPLSHGLKYKNITGYLRIRPGYHKFVICRSGNMNRPFLCKKISIPKGSFVSLVFFGSSRHPNLIAVEDKQKTAGVKSSRNKYSIHKDPSFSRISDLLP